MNKRSIHQKRVDEFMILAGQDVPTNITMPDLITRKLRAKLILEECLETIKALGFKINYNKENVKIEEVNFIDSYSPNLVEIADGCADIKVVTTGTLTACGIDDEPLQNLVDQNNLAKFGPGGYRREDGKWVKPKDHKPPDIKGLLDKTKKE